MPLERIYRVTCDRCGEPVPSKQGVAYNSADARGIAVYSGFVTLPVPQAKGPPKREWVCPDCMAKVKGRVAR